MLATPLGIYAMKYFFTLSYRLNRQVSADSSILQTRSALTVHFSAN